MQACFDLSSTRGPSWCDLPAEVKRLLIAAADTWEDTAQSEENIQQALAIAPCSLDVLVAAYRYFFYKHNNAAALQVATQVVEYIRQSEGFPEDWVALAPILSRRKEELTIRLYLHAYAASGLVMARMGAIEPAKIITTRINEIDDRREFGAANVLDILTQPDDDEF